MEALTELRNFIDHYSLEETEEALEIIKEEKVRTNYEDSYDNVANDNVKAFIEDNK
jgi:hypothetical protein